MAVETGAGLRLVAMVALVFCVAQLTGGQVDNPQDGNPMDADRITSAQLELLKQGKVNKRRLIVRLADNPTDRAAGPTGFDPFAEESEESEGQRDGPISLLAEPDSTTTTTTMTTTKTYSGPGFHASSSITVRRTAFQKVEKVKKEGKEEMDSFLGKNNLTDMKHFWYGARSGLTVLELEDEEKTEELWRKLEKFAEEGVVEYVEPDMLLTTFQSDRCPPITDWGFHQTRTPQALELLGSNDAADLDDAAVLVAVIDSGVDFNHPALRDRIFINEAELNGVDGVDDDMNGFVDDIRGWNFRDNNNDTMDLNGHGTHVAGIMAAAATSDPEFQGIAPNVRILPCRFTGVDRTGSVSDAVRCFEYAWLMGAELSSNSWGAPMAFSRSLITTLQNSEQAGSLAVFAAGNDGNDNDGEFEQVTFPASLPNDFIISVAAIDTQARLLDMSNFGTNSVDIGAPGGSILSTSLDGKYVRMSGTSMATPFVTGAAALLLGACKQRNATAGSCTQERIKEAILSGAEDTGQRVLTGGHLDLSRAVEILGLNVGQSSTPEVELTQCGAADLAGVPIRLTSSLAFVLAAVLWLL